jgi:alkylation response protein AidB-like acyl-CoA dehydrogenase
VSTVTDRSELDEIAAVAQSYGVERLADVREQFEATDVVDPAIISGLVESGLWSIGLPEAHGGQGADLRTALTVIDRIACTSPTVAIAIVHNHAVAHALVAVGATDLVGRCAGGERAVIAFGDTGDVGAQVLRADLGVQPSLVLTVSRDGRCAIVSAASDVDAGAPHQRSGLPGLGTAPARVRGALLTWGDFLGGEAAIRWWKLGLAASALGAARAATVAAGQYVRSREQFGAPLIELPAVAALLRAMTHEIRTSDLLMADLIDTGATDLSTTANTLCTKAIRICLDAIQLHGGYGYLTEYGVEGLARDCMSTRAAQA